jgi:superfamily II DNA helicase RecQ
LDVLLRGHGGIFDHPIAIQEAHLAKRLRKGDFEREASPEEIQQVQRMLQQMAALKLLRYQPATEWPILMLNEPRSLYPSLNMGLLQRLLQRRMEALQQLESYATGQVCRSTFWKTYFTNETPDRDCGTCDICKRRNRIAGDLKSRQFWQTTLQSQPQANATQLLKQVPLTQQGILVQTLRILLDEGCIIENENQALTWVGESFLQ